MDQTHEADLLIIGGGINGVGLALDAAGRGLRVHLCEQNDLTGTTSSHSSKLIHGGIDDLRRKRINVVQESLRERAILLKKAPHLIQPLRFVLPWHGSKSHHYAIRFGLFLYDHLHPASRLQNSESIHIPYHPAGQVLGAEWVHGFVYSDCQVDDARLVILNAIAAREKGAIMHPRTELKEAIRQSTHWDCLLQEKTTGAKLSVAARVVVNTAGPWADEVRARLLNQDLPKQAECVQGSHLVVPQCYSGQFALTLPHTDGRIIFMMPWLDRFTLIGTTEIPFSGDPNTANVTQEEIAYLCAAVNHYLRKPLMPEHICWQYTGIGIRALRQPQRMGHPSLDLTKESLILLETEPNKAALVSFFGGRMTTYRSSAEKILKKLTRLFPKMGKPWTEHASLPGSEDVSADTPCTFRELERKYTWLPNTQLKRYLRNYGNRTSELLGDSASPSDLGEHFGSGLYAKEVEYLMNQEWATTVEDILWHRTKLGLLMSPEEIKKLAAVVRS